MDVSHRRVRLKIRNRLRALVGRPLRRAWAFVRGGRARLDLFDRRMRGWPGSRLEFDEFWGQATPEDYYDPSRLRLFDEVCERLPPAAGRWLDIGCGDGYLLARISGGNEGACFVGVDYSHIALRGARRRLRSGAFVQMDAEHLGLARDCFDVILITETLEHLPNPRAALDRAWRSLAPGGHICITVPDGEIDDWVGHAHHWPLGAFRRFVAPYPIRSIDRNSAGDTIIVLLQKETA